VSVEIGDRAALRRRGDASEELDQRAVLPDVADVAGVESMAVVGIGAGSIAGTRVGQSAG
jgi:hypothetical protein